jgi:hypothetical protein
MAKPLTTQFQGETVHFQLNKVERAKLYGYIDTEVVDSAGKPCQLATLVADGHSIVGKGGTALAYLTPDGLWRKKTELQAYDRKTSAPITPVKSTFDAPVALTETITVDEYLLHNIHLIYQLTPDEESAPLKKALAGGTIFHFPFSYRGGLEASAGFLLQGADGNTFLCVGTKTTADFVDLPMTAVIPPEGEEPQDEGDDDVMDFGQF